MAELGEIASVPEALASALLADELTSPKADVVLVCPLPKEAVAGLAAFDDDFLGKEDRNLEGRKIYFKTVERTDRRSLSVAIAVIAQPRNVPAAIATLIFLAELGTEAAFLCGIGGGVKEKVQLGDVVVSRSVIDVAGGRQEVGGVRDRYEPLPLPLPISRQFLFFVASGIPRTTWRRAVHGGAAKLRATDLVSMPTQEEIDAAPFELDDGIIVAGERLVADGSLPAYLAKDDRIRSCDMEGSGFAQSCDERKVHWGIFRGISDYGDPDKTNEWQAIAAFAAVRAAMAFLATEFRLREEMQSPSF